MKKKRLNDKHKNVKLSFSNKNKVYILRKTKHKIQKQLLRRMYRMKILESELNNVQENLNNMSNITIDDLIIKHSLNDSQSVMLREIVNASKYKKIKNKKYSENWLLLRLLFNIRESGAYNFLLNQNLLPLPCTNTIRKYISMVITDCGFDNQFFSILRKRMFKKSEQ